MIKRDPKSGEYLGIQCSECETMAPPAEEILAGSGLNNMGWHCSGGIHLCPVHAPEDRPQRRQNPPLAQTTSTRDTK